MNRLSTRDRWILWTFVSAFAVCVTLHAYQVARTGLAQPPVFAVFRGLDAYPVVGGFRLETDSTGTGLEVGDRLIEVGGEDLRGAGFVGFEAIALEKAGTELRTTLVYERDGARNETELRTASRPLSWSRLPLMITLVVLSTLAFVRSGGTRSARAFFLAFTGFAILQSIFFGGPRLQSYLAAAVWNLFGPVSVVLMFRWAILFPDEAPDEERPWMGWAYVAGGIYAGLRVNYALGWPIPSTWITPVSFAMHSAYLVAAPAIVAFNYRRADPVGRRRARWVIYGGLLGGGGLALVQLAPLLSGGSSSSFLWTFPIAILLTSAFPVCVFIALVRSNLFDIDRLISVTASYSVVLVSLAVTALAVVAVLSTMISGLLDVPREFIQLALGVTLASAAIPLSRIVRPRIDRLFFPEREALARGTERLLANLSACADTDSLLELVRERVDALLRPEHCLLYRVAGARYEPAVSGDDGPPPLEASTRVIRDLASRSKPLDVSEQSGLAVPAAVLLPLRRGSELAAFIALGPKRSGDVYTTTDLLLLRSVAERAAAELRRLKDAEALERERALVDELRRLKIDAETANLAKSRFLAAASHDLRQPIHALGLFVDALDEQVGGSEPRATVGRIKESLRSLVEMLNALLDISRLDAGSFDVRVSEFAIKPLIDRLHAEFSPAAEAKGLELRAPPCFATVRSDPVLLGRILQNLIQNAIRYTAAGTVAVICEEKGTELRIVVADTGPGIPISRQREVFGEFVQLEKRGGTGGLGLGLSIVERLAKLLDHELDLESAPGEGTRFALLIPSVVRAAGAHVPTRSAPAATDLTDRFIVIVDDDLTILAGMKTLLASWGCEMLLASSIDEAVEGLGARKPDAIVADWTLGGGQTGAGAVGRIREVVGSRVPAVLVTGDTAPARLAEIRALGFPHLTKPVAPARLRAVVQELVRQAPAVAPTAEGHDPA